MGTCGDCVSHNRDIKQSGPALIGRCMKEGSRVYGVATNAGASAKLMRCGAYEAGEPRRYTLGEDIRAMEAANARLKSVVHAPSA